MKFAFTSALVVALAAQGTVASTWFGKAVYNKWHETELERWLSDHNIPYPTPSDRKDLENLVKKNWNDQVVTPYNNWETPQLQSYLKLKGYQAKDNTVKNKDSLVQQVKNYWTETEDSVAQAYGSTKDWIFDSWTDSQLKAFADKHGIPVPQPRKRDSLLQAIRENYESAAKKAKQTTAYPGDWLYDSWSESDLKAWLDERGLPSPQPTSRDKLIASVRRNSRLASLNAQATSASISASAHSALASLSDQLIDSWSDTQIKAWCDKNGIPVPQGSRRNELVALVRKHRASMLGDNVSATVTSAYGAATSNVGNQYAYATNGFAGATNWLKAQIGLAANTASAYGSGASASASASASSVSGRAAKSASSASAAASKSSASASASASKGAKGYKDAAAEGVKRGADKVKKGADYVKEEL